MEAKRLDNTPAAVPAQAASVDEMRAKILRLEAAMLSMTEHQVVLEPKHYFAPGIYLRELFIPKGTTLTGMIHKTEHYCILAQGEVSVRTENGIRQIKAPAVIHSLPGMKRVLHAHEDSTWVNVHHNPTNERELDKIEKIYTAQSYDELLELTEAKKLQGGT
jgi:hypothetical protein